jgi:hypothetical protein
MHLEAYSVLGPLDVHVRLIEAEVPHEMIHLPRIITSADELPDAVALPATRCIGMRFYKASQNPGLVALALPAGFPPDPVLLAGVGLGKLRTARSSEVSAVTDYSASLAGPLCLPGSVKLFVDAALAGEDVLYCLVGDQATVLGIRSADLLTFLAAPVVALSPTTIVLPGHRRPADPGELLQAR